MAWRNDNDFTQNDFNPLPGKCSYLITWVKLRKLIYTLTHNEFIATSKDNINNQKIQGYLV